MITSPCIGLCRLDPESTLCLGCARSGTEIATWKDGPPANHARIWADLPRRRAALGITLYRQGWTTEEIAAFVRASLGVDGATWALGVPGMTAGFSVGGRDSAVVDGTGSTITASTPAGAIRFAITDRVRVLGRSVAGGATADPSIGEPSILAIPRSAALPRPNQGLTPLGTDHDAIRPEDRAGWLFDLGLDSMMASCCVRTTDSALAAELKRRAGQGWTNVRQRLADEGNFTWVVSNSLVRVEVGASVNQNDRGFSEASAGCQPPVFWVNGRLEARGLTPPARQENPFGADIPESFVPCAIFRPGSNSVVAARSARQG